MSNVVFFSFKEADREEVLLIKGRAHNSKYTNLDFKVRDLIVRWDTNDEAKIKQAITTSMKGTSRTIVFVGKKTHKSYWIPHEVEKTLDNGKKLFAMFLKDEEDSKIPKCLEDNNIHVYKWSESKLQDLATK